MSKQTLKQSWRRFEKSPPGERFQRRFEGRTSGGPVRKVLFIGAGILVMAAGVVLLPAPGPGMLVIAFGAGLIAEESRWAARMLDRLEIGLRKAGGRFRRFWKKASLPMRTAVALGALLVAGAVVLGAYRWLAAD